MTITVRHDLEMKLAAVAGQLDRDPEAMVDALLTAYVEDEAEFLAAVQEGRDAVARGDVVPHAQVMAEIDAIIAEAEERLEAEHRA